MLGKMNGSGKVDSVVDCGKESVVDCGKESVVDCAKESAVGGRKSFLKNVLS